MRVFRRGALAMLLLVALLLAGVIALLTTSAGARLVLDQVAARFPATLQGVEGSLLGGLALAEVTYATDALTVAITDLRVAATARCLLRRRVCIDTLSADAVTLLVAPSADPDGEPWSLPAAPLPWLPDELTLVLANLEVGSLTVLQSDPQGSAASEIHLEAIALRDLDVGVQRATLGALAATYAGVASELSAAVERTGVWSLELASTLPDAPAKYYGDRWPDAIAPDLPLQYAVDASGDLATARLMLRSQPGERIAVSIEASANEGAQRLDLALRGEGAPVLLPALAASPWTQLAGPLRVDAVLQPGGHAATLSQSLAGYGPDPVPLRVELAERPSTDASPSRWSLDLLRLGAGAKPRILARGSLGSTAGWEPELELSLDDFSPPAAAQLPVSEVSGELSLGLALSDPRASWRADIESLSLLQESERWAISGSLHAAPEVFLPRGELAATRGELALRYSRGSQDAAPARLALPAGIAAGELRLASAEARVVPAAGGGLDADLSVQGDVAGQWNLTLRPGEEDVAFALAPFAVTALEQPVTSQAPIQGHWRAATSTIDLDAFCLGLRRNRLCSDGASLGNSGSLALRLRVDERHEDVLGSNPFQLRLRGAGDLALSWADATLLEATLALESEYLEFDPFVKLEAVESITVDEATLAARYTPAGASLKLDIDGGEWGALAVALSEEGGRLDGRVDARQVNVTAFDPLLPDVAMRSGMVDGELLIAGTRATPTLAGTLRLADGAFKLQDIDTTLEEVRLELNGDGEGGTLAGDALLGGGPLRVTGTCCDAGRLRMEIIGERNRLRLPAGVDAVLSPDLKVALGSNELDLTGRVTVHDGVLEHSAPAEGGVPHSRDVVRVGAEDASGPFAVRADLRTIIEPGFTVRSRELEATVAGDLRLTLRPEVPPALFGNLQVLGGELRAYGQALRLTEGAVGFVGEPLNPDLSLNAEREIRAEQLRVGFRVRGTLETPSLELFSDPPRPERETLSYLLRGRGPDAGAAMDGTAMALSLGASAINQSGVLESLNNIPGLSEVTLGAEGNDDAMAATISAYVGERLYLSYGVGIYEPVNALTARLYLRSRLWLEVVSRLESSFDLYYRFDRP